MGWALLRSLLVIAAVLGLMGQTTVRAAPMQVLSPQGQSTMSQHCLDTVGVTAGEPARSDHSGRGTARDCIGKMGCSLLLHSAPDPGCAAPVRYERVVYAAVDEPQRGLTVSPEVHPPPGPV